MITLNKNPAIGNIKEILVIRRDNIGDLVCTTPCFNTIKKNIPEARLAVFVNDYNMETIYRNPFVDSLYFYQKSKHSKNLLSKIKSLIKRAITTYRLRQENFDVVILAGSKFSRYALRSAKLIKPKYIISYGEEHEGSGVDYLLPPIPQDEAHEVEAVNKLLEPLGINSPPEKALVVPDQQKVDNIQEWLRAEGINTTLKTIGIHISARETERQWPTEKFAEFIQQISKTNNFNYLIFWAPGAPNDPHHPGDDDKAAFLKQQIQNKQIAFCRTTGLSELIAGIACTDLMVCSDGGALHIAAGLGKPVLGFFENNPNKTKHWYPWGVPHEITTSEEYTVETISVDAAVAAFNKLLHSL